jgi:hypothetical protein
MGMSLAAAIKNPGQSETFIRKDFRISAIILLYKIYGRSRWAAGWVVTTGVLF